MSYEKQSAPNSTKTNEIGQRVGSILDRLRGVTLSNEASLEYLLGASESLGGDASSVAQPAGWLGDLDHALHLIEMQVAALESLADRLGRI